MGYSPKGDVMATWLRILVAAITMGLLAACGGGNVDEAPVLQHPFGDGSTAIEVNATLTGTWLDHARALAAGQERRRVLSANAAATAAASRVPTADETMDWAEKRVPGLFPGHQPTQVTDYQSALFDYRMYAAPGTKLGYVYLGVRRNDGAVMVLFSDGELKHYGYLSDYTCDVLGCGSVTPTVAGHVDHFIDRLVVKPLLFDGKILGNSEGELDPATLDRICAEGPDYGFDTSKTCGTYQNGQAEIKGVSNNSKVQYVGRLKGNGKRVWFTIDPTETTHFTFSGMNARFRGGFVEYSEYVDPAQPDVVYRKPTVLVSSKDLKLLMGRNQFVGFGLDGKLTDFSTGNYQFRFQPKKGKIQAMAVATWDDVTKQYVVTFSSGLACSDTGTITVHRQLVGGGYSTSPVGWLLIGRGSDNEPVDITWNFKAPGVVPVVDTGAGFYGFRYQLTGC